MEKTTFPKYMSITGEPLNLDFHRGFTGKCRHINEFRQLNQLGEGTYGVVHRASDLKKSSADDRNAIVALKQVRIFDGERQNGIPITALREIFLLRSLNHRNVINVLDVAVGDDMDEVYMVMEYAEQDLANLYDHTQVNYSMSDVKCLAKQLFEGLDYLHRNDIIHRDIKMSNLLLTAKGTLKIADFGMAREYDSRPLTPQVVTIWYRSPEILFGSMMYTPSADIWSAGMVLGELIDRKPLCPGDSEIDQVRRIVSLLGAPNERIWPKMRSMPDFHLHRLSLAHTSNNLEKAFLALSSKATVELLNACLTYDPDRRITARHALQHAYFRESPVAKEPSMLPTFPEIRNGDGPAGGVPEKKDTMSVNGKRGGGNNPGYVFDFDGAFGGPSKKKHRAG